MEQILPKIELEKMLERLKPHPEPYVWLEQYTTPTIVAAELLFTAAYIHDDLENKLVVDLGCGTGRLGIGALLIGARSVVGIDIDPRSIAVAKENAKDMGVQYRCNWVIGDISLLRGAFDIVLMNPPFGTRRRHIDLRFLSEALRLSGCIYSLHKSSTRQFIRKFICRHGGIITALFKVNLEIPRMFSFHELKRRFIPVDIYRIMVPNHRIYKNVPSKT